jgi:ribosomal protein S12 methylthiotransferase
MEVQQQISAELNRQKIGQSFKVIIDRKEDDYFVGRTEYDSPEVDGEVLISSASELKKGEFYHIKITGAEDYDLFGAVE